MLSINTIARVIVNTIRASSSAASFDTGLLLVPDAGYAEARRLNEYRSAEAAAAALSEFGFASTSEAYKSAVKYFAASPAPSRLYISCYPTSEMVWDALADVLALTADFYGVMPVGTLTNDTMADFAMRLEALSVPLVLFAPVTSVSTAAPSVSRRAAVSFSRPANSRSNTTVNRFISMRPSAVI